MVVIPDAIVVKAAKIGIESKSHLEDMIKRAARITHDNGNYRFWDYVFDIRDLRLIAISVMGSEPLLRITVFNCNDCGDDGGHCLSCNR